MLKKNLLIYWPTRNFLEVIAPLLKKLNVDNNIFLLLSNQSRPIALINNLELLKNNKIIKDFYITPSHNKLLKNFIFLKKMSYVFKNIRFDVFLSGSEMQPYERYLIENILPKKCRSILFWNNITYLFMYYKSFSLKLLEEKVVKNLPNSRENFKKNKKNFILKLRNFIYEKKYQSLNLKNFSSRFNVYLKLLKRLKLQLVYFYYTKKFFKYRVFDKMTQIGSGNSDAIIFCDELESKAHKLLYNKKEIFTSEYPSSGLCRCNNDNLSKKIILSPLSGFEGNSSIPEEILFLYYRDFNTIISKSGASEIHLRLHPDFINGGWSQQLKDYLINKGINTKIVDSDQPIHSTVCNYIGVAGFASAALRDARAACDYAFVIGLTAVSRTYFNDPRFAFGNSEGINWINDDGSYNHEIFQRKKFVFPKRLSVPEILNKF